VFIIPEVNLA
jgi:hypothetical protein